MRKVYALIISLVAMTAIFFVRASPTIHLVDLNDVDASGGLNDGQVLAWNASAQKFQPITLGTGGGGIPTSISANGGTVNFDSTGRPQLSAPTAKGIVLKSRLDSILGVPSDVNSALGVDLVIGVQTLRFAGTDTGWIPIAKPYQIPNDVSWTAFSQYGTVISAATTGTADVIVRWTDRSQGDFQYTAIQGFDLTAAHNNSLLNSVNNEGYFCLPIQPRSTSLDGVYVKIIGHNVTGTNLLAIFDFKVSSHAGPGVQ